MKVLKLYPELPTAPVEAAIRLDCNKECTLCPLSVGVRTVCMSAEGAAGGLLVVGESPGETEDSVGRPFIGPSGKLLREQIQKHWDGPVAIDNALRCAPGRREIKDKYVDACRSYLAQTISEAQPTRIIALGGWSVYSLTGRGVAMLTTRRGYTWFYRSGEAPVPVFYVMHPAAALRNRFVRRWFEADIAWALTCSPPQQPPLDGEARVVRSVEDAEFACRELRAAGWLSFDVETCGVPRTSSFRLLCVSFCGAGSTTAYTWDRAALRHPAWVAPLRALLTDPSVRKTGQNVKFDDTAVQLALGVSTAHIKGDARLWRKLLDPEADGHLDKMVELIGMGGMKEEAEEAMSGYVERLSKAKATERRLAKNAKEDAERKEQGLKAKNRAPLKDKAREDLEFLHSIDDDDPVLASCIRNEELESGAWKYGLLPEDLLCRYNGRDSVATVRLLEHLDPQFADLPSIDRVRHRIVDRAERAIKRMEGWGIGVNRTAMEALDAYCTLQLASVRARLDNYVKDLNPNSPPQVAALLFGTGPGQLRLKPAFVTKGGGAPSTAEEALLPLAEHHPVVRDILDYRGYTKLQGQYASGMVKHVRDDDRIHPSILLDGAETGRTSCRDPNLQNIPRAQTVDGKMCRDCFVARPGFKLIELDYSQIELRIAAALSGDKEMIAIFKSGVDYHLRTAQLVAEVAWGIKPEMVTDWHRSASKSINFGVLYGMGDVALAAKIKAAVKIAERIRLAIMGKFKRLDAWIKECLLEAQKTGYTWTYWAGERARRRSLWRIGDKDDKARSRAENGAHNTPVQGTSSEFLIASIVECVDWIDGDGIEDICKLVLPVHDSLMFEAREDFVQEAAVTARDIMLSHDSWGVPMVVDCKVGDSWGALKKAKFIDTPGERTRLVVSQEEEK